MSKPTKVVYVIGKNNYEITISLWLQRDSASQSPDAFFGIWKASKGVKVRRGDCQTGINGMYLYKTGAQRIIKNTGISLEFLIRKDGTFNTEGDALIARGWKDKSNEGEHKWTTSKKKAEEMKKHFTPVGDID